jgi:SAM-dependent methyltransferase
MPAALPLGQELWRRKELRLARALWHRLRRRTEMRDDDSEEKGADWYDHVFSDPSTVYHVHYTESPYYFLWAVMADRMPSSPSILEIGCGTGQLISFLMERGIANYVGFDFSHQAVAAAKERCPSLEFHVADARGTELLDREDYNVVICTEVLEHIEADLDVLRRIRPGTRCLLTVPSFPYPGHVRCFESTDQVSDRYGPFFGKCAVAEFLKNSSGDRFFLLDGVRSGGA